MARESEKHVIKGYDEDPGWARDLPGSNVNSGTLLFLGLVAGFVVLSATVFWWIY